MDSHNCARCGFKCKHVEAAGMWACPNCGPPIDHGDHVTYEFNKGCSSCNLKGHEPLPGYMKPVPHDHPRAVFGLAPVMPDEMIDESYGGHGEGELR